MNLERYIVSRLGDDFIRASSTELRYKCPYCPDLGKRNNDYKFYINTTSALYNCFRCGAHGRLVLDKLLLKGNVTDVYKDLTSLLSPDSKELFDPDYYMLPIKRPYPGTLVWNYLNNRGIGVELIKKYDIRYYGESEITSHLRGRFVIPNRVISENWTDTYVARTYIDEIPRYKNPPRNKTHGIVFNLHNIPDNPEYIIINEGPLNSIVAGDLSVATYGKFVSNDQLSSILSKHPKNIYVSLDEDAKKYALDLCDKIVSYSDSNVYLVDLSDGKDAVDLGREEYLYRVKNSISYSSRMLYELSQYFNQLKESS